MKQTTKRIVWLGSILLIGGLLLYFFYQSNSTKEYNSDIQTTTVARGNIVSSVTATGTVEPLVTVEVGTQVSGEISKIYVDYSSEVKKGQLLAELDPSTLKASLISAKASYEAAQNELSYQKKTFERTSLLYETQAVSQTDYETALYQFNNAKHAFTRAEQEYNKAQTNLSYASIYAPIDGVILTKAVDEGQTVAASFSTPTMFTIAKDLKEMRVVADVDEADIGQVQIGQRVQFSVDAFPDDIFEGTVTIIRLEAQINSNVVTYEVVIHAPNPDLKLLPGLTANVTLFTKECMNVCIIPQRAMQIEIPTELALQYAITESDVWASSQDTGVWVLSGPKQLKRKPIHLGETDGIHVEVIDGLKEGDVVVTDIRTTSIPTQNVDDSNQVSSPFMPKRPNSKK